MSDSMDQLVTWAMIGKSFQKVTEDRERKAREMINALSESEYEELLQMCSNENERNMAIRLRGK